MERTFAMGFFRHNFLFNAHDAIIAPLVKSQAADWPVVGCEPPYQLWGHSAYSPPDRSPWKFREKAFSQANLYLLYRRFDNLPLRVAQSVGAVDDWL